MSRYHDMFERLGQHQGAFIPYVMLYDPDRATSKKIINAVIEAGADALELGIAFSDPLADGPTIQKAGLRALKNHSTVSEALSLVHEIRDQHPHIPIGILTYANLVYKNSLDWFYARCHDSGVDSVLVADVPLLEIEPFFQAAIKHHIDPVLIAPANMPKQRIKELAHYARGYTYVVTRSGVTGCDRKVKLDHRDFLAELKAAKAPPVIFGFGISEPSHVEMALKQGAAGAISGSKIVSIIENNLDNQSLMLHELTNFIRLMKKATYQ